MRRTAILITGTLFIAAIAAAQEKSGEKMPAPLDSDATFLSQEIFALGGNLVKGAPYTATAITETNQVLADGNKVASQKTALLARDSQGRTRREESLKAIGVVNVEGRRLILISDPVAQRDYLLEPERRSALILKHEELKVRTEGPNVEKPTGGITREQRLARMGVVREAALSRESLGTQIIEGISCEGYRVTETIPAGAIGNERAIVISSETWTSPDLHVLVMRKRSDPRFGETVYRLTNISRAEPDPSLFQVPGNYKVQNPKERWSQEE